MMTKTGTFQSQAFYLLALIISNFGLQCFNVLSMARRTERIDLPSSSMGTRRSLIVHRYLPSSELTNTNRKKVYIQASLHADEIPGTF